jgi:hypothetical protein
MPQTSPNTFSIGQKRTNKDGSPFLSTQLVIERDALLDLSGFIRQEDVSSVTSPTISTDDVQAESRESSPREFLSGSEGVLPYESCFPPRLKNIADDANSTFVTKQLWAGKVTQVRPDEFVAEVLDRTNPSNPPEEVSFDLLDVDREDRSLVVPGSSFFWIIGRRQNERGQVERITKLKFRRLPTWTPSSIVKAALRAELTKKLMREPD